MGSWDGQPNFSTVHGLEGLLPPANLEAEQALLGAIMANQKAYERVRHFLRPEHFADAAHQVIYRTAQVLVDAGRVPDAVMIRTALEHNGELGAAGGPKYLATLLAAMVGIAPAESYGRLILDCWTRREMIAAADAMKARAHDGDPTASGETLLGEGLGLLHALSNKMPAAGNLVSAGDALMKAFLEAEAAYKRNGVIGMSAGFPDVDDKVGGLEPGGLYLLGARPGMGKAQPLGAHILRQDGTWTTMGEVRLGERLASIDGAPSMVSGIYDRGEMEVFRVTFSDGRSTRACADHLWRVMYRDWDAPRIVNTAKLQEMLERKRYRNRLSIDLVSGHFGGGDLPLDPYVLGALIGDGGLRRATPQITTPDEAILEEVDRRLNGAAEVRKAAGSRYAYSIVSRGIPGRLIEDGAPLDAPRRYPDLVGDDEPRRFYPRTVYVVTRALKAMGLMGLKSEEKFIPPCYLAASRQDRLDLLRGLLDTDGWSEKNGSVRFGSSSEQLARSVQALVRSLGGLCGLKKRQTFYTYKGEKKPGLPSWVCMIRHERGHELFALPRKAERARRTGNASVRLNVASVESCGVERVRCIAVTHPSHLYVTDEYTVTHNTSYALQFALRAASARMKAERRGETDLPAGRIFIASLEMGASQLARRALALSSGVDLQSIRRGAVMRPDRQHDLRRLMHVRDHIQSLPLLIEDTPQVTMAAIERQAEAARRRLGGLDCVVIDHLHIVGREKVSGKFGDTQAMGEISRAAKAMAKRLGVPVVALCQLSRGCESREDKRPVLSDLRQSGDLEQDADGVWFLYRHDYYLGRQPPGPTHNEPAHKHQERVQRWHDEKTQHGGKAEFIIAKNRDGEGNTTVVLGWDERRVCFTNQPDQTHQQNTEDMI